jgi:hypothetical protein
VIVGAAVPPFDGNKVGDVSMECTNGTAPVNTIGVPNIVLDGLSFRAEQ